MTAGISPHGRLCHMVVALVFALFCGLADTRNVQADDIRADSAIDGAGSGPQPYVAVLTECDSISGVRLPDGSPVTLTRTSGSGCEARFSVAGPQRLSPSLSIFQADGSSRTLSESLPPSDAAAPAVGFGAVAIDGSGGQQELRLTFTAQDNIDLRFVSVDVIGMRASVLRQAGGVVGSVLDKAFARAQGLRVYPEADAQTSFVVRVPVQ